MPAIDQRAVNQQIRMVSLSSLTVTTLAGGGSNGGTASGFINGVGTSALFSYPVYAEAVTMRPWWA